MKAKLAAASIIAAISMHSSAALAFDGGVGEIGEGTSFQTSTMVVPGSLQIDSDGTSATYEAVDSAGNHYAVYFNSQTGEVLATSSNNLISNQLTPDQLAITRAKYQEARTQGAIILVPIAIGGGMCYLNDLITKNQHRRHCEDAGGTVVVESSGMCGFGASYHCDVPEPDTDPPVPPPPPGTIFGFDMNGQFGPIGGSNPFGRNTFDSDWFGCLSHSGCG